jgi:glycerate dehydrogenase
MINIVFLDEYSLCDGDLTPIRSQGNYTGYHKTFTTQEVIERCQEADVVISNKVIINREAIKQLPRLKLICVAATGMNNIDLEAAREQGIPVRNAVGYSTHAVAETTLSSVLALLRRVVYYDRYVKSGDYASSDVPFHFGMPTAQLHGKRWGIIGLGNIGREVARLAEAFGCRVAYSSTSGISREEAWPQLPLEELLRESDVLTIHCPLNERTRNLIGARELSLMKSSALLVNVARGGIVDEGALVEALDKDLLAGAAIDVYGHEPIEADSPLLRIQKGDKLLLSPHNAWSPREAIERLIACIAENIKQGW